MKKTIIPLSSFVKKRAKEGIKADPRHLLEDIISQFSDHRECFREYVVNSSDANADWCRVRGVQEGESITIFIEDNGHGMNKQRVKDFMTLFKSVKEGDPRKAVGRFGVGKASILAIPELTGFTMVTSTGNEAWRMELTSFLDDNPVHVKPVNPPPPQGTCFTISFNSSEDLATELQKIGDILSIYVRYLPMDITVQNLDHSEGQFSRFRHINARWSPHQERLGRRFTFTLNDASFEVIIGLGPSSHEIYQNKVLVTNRYNLFSRDLATNLTIANISLRVDSPDFELPFGRHGLRNEEILRPLSRYLRETVLPIYFDELWEIHLQERMQGEGQVPRLDIDELEELACCLLKHDASIIVRWAEIPLFAVLGEPRMSWRKLKKLIDKSGKIYLEDAGNAGVDYTAFDGPVLSTVQPRGGMDFLKQWLGSRLVNLGMKDMVLEQPANGGRKLGKAERRFESFLGFHPDLVAQFQENEQTRNSESSSSSSAPGNFSDLVSMLQKNSGLSQESRQARCDLEHVSWRVNYLVERDGTTPCKSQKFLYKDSCVVLNLYHPEVDKLLTMSASLPALAGHWALALCLEGDKKILPHLTPEGREDLMRLDALVRSNVPPEKLSKQDESTVITGTIAEFRDYVRSLSAGSWRSDTIN